MYNVTISIRLTDKNYEEIKKIAEKEKRSINGQINYVIEKYIEEQEKKDN